MWRGTLVWHPLEVVGAGHQSVPWEDPEETDSWHEAHKVQGGWKRKLGGRTWMVRMKFSVTLSSRSLWGVYRVRILTICQQSEVRWKTNTLKSRLTVDEQSVTCWLDRAVQVWTRACASASVFFPLCRSWTAWMRGSNAATAPPDSTPRLRSHSSNRLTL